MEEKSIVILCFRLKKFNTTKIVILIIVYLALLNLHIMAESSNALSYEKAINLLPSSFKPMTCLSKQQNIYSSNNGKIILKQSKIHNSNQLWQSIKKEQLTDNNIYYVCLIAGFLGVLLLPTDFLLNYFEKDNVTCVKNGRYNIRIQIDGTKFILGESGREKYDITEFFIPN